MQICQSRLGGSQQGTIIMAFISHSSSKQFVATCLILFLSPSPLIFIINCAAERRAQGSGLGGRGGGGEGNSNLGLAASSVVLF